MPAFTQLTDVDERRQAGPILLYDQATGVRVSVVPHTPRQVPEGRLGFRAQVSGRGLWGSQHEGARESAGMTYTQVVKSSYSTECPCTHGAPSGTVACIPTCDKVLTIPLWQKKV